MADRYAPLAERFWKKVDKSGGPSATCWNWMGTLHDKGYGRVMVNQRQLFAHRVAYEMVKGTIPAGLVLDHLCRNRRCVNPAHLEAITAQENLKRGENHVAEQMAQECCKKGHQLEGSNVSRRAGRPRDRICLACRRQYLSDSRKRKRALEKQVRGQAKTISALRCEVKRLRMMLDLRGYV